MLMFFKTIINSIYTFIKQNKIYFFLILIVIVLGIAFGVENVKQLRSDLDLSDITDNCFTNASNGTWSFYSFFLNRFTILIIPSFLVFLCVHFIFVPIIFVISFANAYFYAFNFMILVYNLNTVGLVYVFVVCLPCYLIYLLVLTLLYITAFKRLQLKRKYNNCCFSSVLKEIKLSLLFVYIIFLLTVIYESIFLYLIYNKYIFAMA